MSVVGKTVDGRNWFVTSSSLRGSAVLQVRFESTVNARMLPRKCSSKIGKLSEGIFLEILEIDGPAIGSFSDSF